MPRIDPASIYIIYDMDDTLHPYVQRIAEKCGVDIQTWEHFYVPDNNWSDEVKHRLNQEFLNPAYFRNIRYFEGVGYPLRPHTEFGVRVGINTNALTEEIKDNKCDSLLGTIPGLTEDMITVNQNLLNQVRDKELPPGTYIFVDDNPHHIVKSTARLNLLPCWPWNMSDSARIMLHPVPRRVYLKDLKEINSFVYWHIHRCLSSMT